MKNPYDKPEASFSHSFDEDDDVQERKLMLDGFDDIPLQENQSRLHRRKYVTTVSLGANLLLFVIVLFQLAHPCFFSARQCVYEKRGKNETTLMMQDDQVVGGPLMSDVNGIVPEFKTERVTFNNDSRYGHSDMFADKASYQTVLDNYSSLMPLGRGFVTVENASSYPALQNPWHNAREKKDGFSIAYLHQIHCLFMILKAHGDLRLGIDHHYEPAEKAEKERHVTHCFDYLRQSIWCAGDSALEGKSRTPGLEMTDGWGDVHVCKSGNEEIKWVLDNRYGNNKGID